MIFQHPITFTVIKKPKNLSVFFLVFWLFNVFLKTEHVKNVFINLRDFYLFMYFFP